MVRLRDFLINFVLISYGFYCEEAKLNYPRVLLPIFDKISVNFTLEVVEKGCYKWVTPRSDLINIVPLYDENDCSYRAVITVLTKEKRRNTALILSENLKTGEFLRCGVLLDVIDKLGVLTTTRELYLEEAPETFELWAQDSQGNAFSTLEGVEFKWEIISQNYETFIDEESVTNPILKIIQFKESKYHTVPRSLEKFEELGLKGYMCLLEGVNTGKAKVGVQLPYPEYSHIPKIEVDITVLANIILDPIDVHILVDDTVTFRVLQLKHGKLEEITLNDRYYLEIDDNSIVRMNGNTALGLKLGKTTIFLRDRYVPYKKGPAASPISKSTITVATPYKLTINLLPYLNWVTVEGEKHQIALDLYTRDNQRIWLGPKYSVNCDFDESVFYALDKSKNGSRIYGEAVREGQIPVQGYFQSMKASAELKVYKELTLSPMKVILPFEPANSARKQRIQFSANGGDGIYYWTSYNPSLLHITQKGLMETVDFVHNEREIQSNEYFHFDHQKDQNSWNVHTHIKVALERNRHISKVADVFFLQPVRLEIVQYNFETALRDYVKLDIALYAYVNDTFMPLTSCSSLNFELEFTKQIFNVDPVKEVKLNENLHKTACHAIHLKSTTVGTTHLTISYKYMNNILKDDVNLVVFEKLNIINPVQNEVVLPIGSARNILYENGPQKIFNVEAELTKLINIDESIAKATEIEKDTTSKPIYVYNILCKKVGETLLTFEIYNQLQTINFEPYISRFTTKIYCVKPRFINLYPIQELRDSCPIEMRNSLMHLKQQQAEDTQIEIEILDAKNRKLMNISSLLIDWQFSQGGESPSRDFLHSQFTETDMIEGITVPGKDILSAALADMTMNFQVKATVTGYDEKILYHYGIQPERPNFAVKKPSTNTLVKPIIENVINFQPINTTLLSFSATSIYLGNRKPEIIKILQGSGFYDFQLSDDKILQFEYDQRSRELRIIPKNIGHAIIEVTDLCITSEPFHLSLSVVSINSVVVEGLYYVEKAKTVEVIIKLYDSNEQLINIDYDNLGIYELRETIMNPSILSVRLGEQDNLQKGEIRYVITGNELGDTKVIFHSGSGNSKISSKPHNVQVFSPLRLYPRNSTLVIGSSVQLYYHGGPQPDVNIIYSVQNQNLISMDSGLVLGRKIGTTRITGKCIGTNRVTGKEIIFSEDTVEVHVVHLEHILIRVPLSRITVGATMPAYIWGLPDLSPMILGTLDSLRVTWATNQPDIVDIFGVFSEAGIEYTDRDLISVRIRASNPGKVKITATVTLSTGQKLSASVVLTVFKQLELLSPERIRTNRILMAPRSIIQLKANLEDTVYHLDSNVNNVKLSKNSEESNGLITINSDGTVRSSEILGRNVVLAEASDQTLPIEIEVKNVQYILSTLQYPSIRLKQTEDKIPRGMNIVLKISLHDNLGNEFSHNIEDVNALRYDSSHKDAVDIQIGNNQTISLNLLRETSNMISISIKNHMGVKYAEDYIKVSVAESEHLFPTMTIFSPGDAICFESPLTMSTFWASSDENIVTVDRTTGIARVIRSEPKLKKKVTISNGDKNRGGHIKYDLEIREADRIEFLKLFDVFNGNSYRANLIIKNNFQINKTTNLISRNASKCSNYIENLPVEYFTCRMTLKQHYDSILLKNFKVTPFFDKKIGTYGCYIELQIPLSDLMNIAKMNDITMDLEAQLIDNGISDTMTLKLIPGIKVTPDSIPIDSITTQVITVNGMDKVLQKVDVKPSDTKYFDVTQQATKTHGTLQYKVNILRELPLDEDLFIRVHSPLTLETLKIPINQETNSIEKCSKQPFTSASTFLISLLSNIGLIISALFILAVTIWALLFCFPQKSKVDINNEVFSSSMRLDSSAISNISGSPSGNQTSLTPRGPNYPPSSYYSSSTRTSPHSPIGPSPDLSDGNDSPIYGDKTLLSPQKRLYRRHL